MDRGRVARWTTSEKGARSAVEATTKLRYWVDTFGPQILVTENPDAASRKRGRQRDILKAFLAVGDDLPLRNLVVQRRRRHRNIYLEAASAAVRFPELAAVLPEKPPIWRKEPYRLVISEALILLQDAQLVEPGPAKRE